VSGSGAISIAILGGLGTGPIIAEGIRDMARAGGAIDCIGLLNDREPPGARHAGLKVLCGFDDWRDLPPSVQFIHALHKAKEAQARKARLDGLGIPLPRFARVVHPTAVVAESASVGPGSYLGPNVVVMPHAVIGAHVSARAGCYISHDVRVGDFCFVGPNAVLNGRCEIGAGGHVGPGAVVRDEIKVGAFAVVGFASAAVRDVAAFEVVMGVPARRVERLAPG